MAASLEPGVTVSRYSIVCPIGAGGMGEVYKAQDPSLERMVAIKILPPDLVRNDERRRRFMQEARSASSLNHPHIITIHEIGEATAGPGGEPLHYIAMELVDGVTLKRKIHEEQTDLRTIAGYLAQAADGLAKAHAAGIIHRDLKPENVMVTRDGFAKVLDFGLAKLSVRKSATESMDGATVARDDTREGAILGTVAYMSPEQVMGKVVDHRSDIFSFGAILYETATRRRPFEADSDVDVMHKILHDPPPPIDAADARIPAELRRIIRRCLAKDPDRRYHSMKDLAIDLRDLVDNFDELALATASGGSGSSAALAAPVPKRGAGLLIAAAVAVVAIAALAWFVVQQQRGQAAPTAVMPKAEPMRVERLTSSGNVTQAQISPDGRYLALVMRELDGQSSIRVRQIASGGEVEVMPPSRRPFVGLAFSPDSGYVYFGQRDEAGALFGWLYQVPSLGGTPRKIVYDVDTRVTFSPDGRQIAFGRGVPGSSENHYVVCNADGSAPRVVAKFRRYAGAFVIAADWSPDGKKLITARQSAPWGELVEPVEIDLATGAARTVGSNPWWWISSLTWRRDGSGVVMAALRKGHPNSQLWFQPITGGEARRLTGDFTDYRIVSTTADGQSLAAVGVDGVNDLHIASTSDASGGMPVAAERSSHVGDLAASPDGTTVYTRWEDRTANLFVLDPQGSRPRALTTEGFNGRSSITADGKTIVYISFDTEPTHVWAIDADGSVPRQITSGEGESEPRISPDGMMLLYVEKNALWKRPFAGGTPVKVTDVPTGSHGFSPDSRLLFYRSWIGTRIVMRVEPVAGGPPVEIEGVAGRDFAFAPDSQGITYVSAGNAIPNIFLKKLSGGPPVQLTKFTRGGIGAYQWLNDGRLVYIRTERRSDVVRFSGM